MRKQLCTMCGALWLAGMLILACEPGSTAGTQGGSCKADGSCDAGLRCIGKICLEEGSEAGSSADAAPTTERKSSPEPASPDHGSAEKKADKFSFFVTSLEAMQKLSGSKDGFGGNLGGLRGADRICQLIADGVGAGHKTWRAFLSATKGPDGKPVHAIERIGKGPWYDRNQRLIAKDVAGLLSGDRPQGDAQAVRDLANEHGQGQHQFGDNHDVVTGSNKQGKLNDSHLASTCQDWTSAVGPGSVGRIMCGHSWPRSLSRGSPGGAGGEHWLSDHSLRGCKPGVNLQQNGPGTEDCIGCSGGYGGLYCFALDSCAGAHCGTQKAECKSNTDCTKGQRCFLGLCLAASRDTCKADSDCPTGKVCRHTDKGVECTDPPPPCKSNADCQQMQRCQNGQCVTGGGPGPRPSTCTKDGDCPQGQTCAQLGPQKICAPPGAGKSCTQNSDCGQGLQCISSPLGRICAPQPPGQRCRSNAECRNGQRCIQGQCQAAPAACPSTCTSDADCKDCPDGKKSCKSFGNVGVCVPGGAP